VSVGGFVESSWFGFEGVEVDVDVEVWFLAAAGGGVGCFEEAGGEVLEGVVAALGGGPGVADLRWWY
jgi:hypothetical protein